MVTSPSVATGAGVAGAGPQGAGLELGGGGARLAADREDTARGGDPPGQALGVLARGARGRGQGPAILSALGEDALGDVDGRACGGDECGEEQQGLERHRILLEACVSVVIEGRSVRRSEVTLVVTGPKISL